MTTATQQETVTMNEYAHPDKLVSTDWVEAHKGDESVRLVESNEDILIYETGHIPGAAKIDWHTDLQHETVRDYVTPERFAAMCERMSITPETTVVFYGDKSNWWAAYAMWAFEMFGHTNCKLMNGGRKKWQDEGRDMTTEKPSYTATSYPVPTINASDRAFRDDVLAHQNAGLPLIDVRSNAEYSGELLHMADYPQEGALRGGHVRGAANVPWARAAQADGTFKSREELEQIYLNDVSLKPSDDVIAYCRIGERSSHTWFVLKYLLGFEKVRNYDGSWTEWGNLIGMPIETGEGPSSIG